MQTTYTIDFKKIRGTKLIVATSPQLRGFRVVGKCLETIMNDVPVVAADMIKTLSGETVEVSRDDCSDDRGLSKSKVPTSAKVRIRETA